MVIWWDCTPISGILQQYFDYRATILFMDRNKDLDNLNEEIKHQKLSSIADVCNSFLLPNVLWPWVLSEFIHKFWHADMYTVIQLSVQKFNISVVDVSTWSKIEHPHDDYLQESNNEYYMCTNNFFCGWIPSNFNLQWSWWWMKFDTDSFL